MATQPTDNAINGWDEPSNDRAEMSDDEIVNILREQERASVSFRDTVIAAEQAAALDFYEAEPFGDEIPGRSQVVVPDVAEVVDYMQISVLRTVASADRVVEFEPGDTDQMPEIPDEPEQPDLPPPPQDPQQMAAYQQQPAIVEYQQAKAAYDQAMKAVKRWEKQRAKAADDATAAVNHIFMRRQNGYRILVDWLQSGLIEKIGIIKTACVTQRKKIRQSGTVSGDQLAMMAQEGGPNITNVTENGDGTYTIETAAYQEVKRYVDYPVPSEEYIFPPRTKDEDDCKYQAHKCRKTLSDLIEMGFDRETVEALPKDDGIDAFDDQRTWSRWGDDDMQAYQRAPGMQEVMLLEEYARLDLDGDGVAELWQIFRVGDVILEKTEVEESPFVVWTPFPRAHRLVGNSLAEKTMDIQRIDSILLRQALDGVYLTNSPRTWLPEEAATAETIDDLLTIVPGGIVRGRGALPPQKLNDAFDITKSLGMLEYMQSQRETRTGITKLNQGLDKDALGDTASGQAKILERGDQIQEYVARNFAEGMARLFSKKLRLMKAHGEPIAIKIEGNYRRVDPASWDDDMNIAVRVGLGSGSKDQRIMYRMQVAQQQSEALMQGVPITDPKRLYNNAVGFIRDAGLGNPDDYWVDPESEEQQQKAQEPKPDPAMEKVKADAQLAQAKAQGEAQLAQQKAGVEAQQTAQQIELAQQEAAAKLQITQRQGDQQIELQARKAELEQELARDKAVFEANLANTKAQQEWTLAQAQMAHDQEMDRLRARHAHEQGMEKAKVSTNRPGGDLSK